MNTFLQLIGQFSIDKFKEMTGNIVERCYERVQKKQKPEGYITLERGFATIRRPGIDVPFQSRVQSHAIPCM